MKVIYVHAKKSEARLSVVTVQNLEKGVQSVRREQFQIDFRGENASSLNTTFVYPEKGPQAGSPLLLLLNGVNCNSWEYSRFLDNLSNFGYLSVITDLRHKGKLSPDPPEPGCPEDTYLMTSPAILPTVRAFIAEALGGAAGVSTELKSALESINTEGIVLLGHSYGGRTAVELLEGAEPSQTESLLGAFIWEGGKGGDEKLRLPKGTFITYLESTKGVGNFTRKCYDRTEGCSDFIRLRGCNHYGINDFHADREYMVAPCASGINKEVGHFKTTAEQQHSVIDLLSSVAHASIQARLFQSTQGADYLLNVGFSSSLVVESLIDRACLPSASQE